MNFIAILIVLGLVQYLGSASLVHRDAWFSKWVAFVRANAGHGVVTYIASVAIPCFVVFFVLLLMGSWGLGVIQLAIYVVVMMYSIGRGDYNSSVDAYAIAWEKSELEKLPAFIQAIDSDYLPELGEGVQQTHVKARESIVYVGFTRLFVVMFWFALLGPAAALFYRLTQLYHAQLCLAGTKLPIAEIVRDAMEWPAARLYSFTFAIIGDFSKTMASWPSTVLNAGMTSRQVIHANALAALDLGMDWLSGNFSQKHTLQEQAELARKEVRLIKELLMRSLVFSVVGIAIYQIVK